MKHLDESTKMRLSSLGTRSTVYRLNFVTNPRHSWLLVNIKRISLVFIFQETSALGMPMQLPWFLQKKSWKRCAWHTILSLSFTEVERTATRSDQTVNTIRTNYIFFYRKKRLKLAIILVTCEQYDPCHGQLSYTFNHLVFPKMLFTKTLSFFWPVGDRG